MCIQLGSATSRIQSALLCCCVLLIAVSNAEGECYMNGDEVVLDCVADNITLGSSIIWRSEPIMQAGFSCTDENFSANNKITLVANCAEIQQGKCGNNGTYVGRLNCPTYTSTLRFVSNYSLMNGGLLQCFVQGKTHFFLLNIGIVPDPPLNATLSFPEPGVCEYDWLPPEGYVTGGIFGYNISYDGNCGSCAPTGLVSNTTFTAICSNWTANGQNCSAFIQTVTADCNFESSPAEVHSRLDNKAPTNITVAVVCSENTNYPGALVEWEYTIPDAESSILLPGVIGFLVTISSQQSNRKTDEYFLRDSEARSHMFSSTILQQVDLQGNVEALVEVVTEVGNFSNTSMETVSLRGTMADTSLTLTEKQCIEVSINPQCDESADSFQAQLQITDGMCGNDSDMANTTSNHTRYTLRDDYGVCIPVGVDSICYSPIVFYNGLEVGKIKKEELVLIPCNTTNLDLSNSTGIHVQVSSGVDVAHNTRLYLQCDLLLSPISGGEDKTRCVNGTFIPSVDSSYCRNDLGILFAVLIGILGLAIIGVCIICCVCCYRYKQRIGSIDIEDSNFVETENPNSTDLEVDHQKFADSVRIV